MVVALLGIHGGVSRYISVYEERGEYDKLNGYLKFIFRVPVITSCLASIILFIFSEQIANFFNFEPVFVSCLKIISFAIPFKVFNEVIYQIFFAKKKVLIQNIGYNLIEKMILLAGLLLSLLFGLDIKYIIIFLFLSIFITFLFNYLYLKLKIYFKKSRKVIFDYNDWIMFSLPLFFANMFAFVINWTDNITIGKLMTSADLGIYATSFSLASFLIFFQTSFYGIFIPIISRLYAKNNKKTIGMIYQKAQNWIFGLSLPFALVFVFFASDILKLFYGEPFLIGANPLKILTLGLLFSIYPGMNPVLLRVMKKNNYLFKVRVVVSILNLGLNIILIGLFGIIGAAISTAFVFVVEQIVYVFKVKKYVKIKYDFISDTKILLIGLILIMIIKFILMVAGIVLSLPLLILISVLYLISYIIIIIWAKILNKDDQLIFSGLIGNGKYE